MTTIPSVINFMCERTGRRPFDFMGPRRHQPLVFHRQLAYWLCWYACRPRLYVLADAFSRDHTTVMHGVKMIDKRRKDDEAVLRLTDHLLFELGTTYPPNYTSVESFRAPFAPGEEAPSTYANERPALRIVA